MSATAAISREFVPTGWRRVALSSLLFLLLYVALKLIVNRLVVATDTLAWDPSSGLALAFLILYGPRLAPALFLAVLLSAVYHKFQRDTPVSTARSLLEYFSSQGLYGFRWTFALACVVTGAYLGGERLLRHALRFNEAFRTQRDAVYYAAVALLVPLAMAAFAAYTHGRHGAILPADLRDAAVHYWLVDSIGLLTTGPLLLIAADRIRHGIPREERRRHRQQGIWRWVEIVGQTCALAAALWAMFFFPTESRGYAFYPALPPLVWILLRSGLWGAAVGSWTVCAASMFCAWWLKMDTTQLRDLQAFLMVMSLSVLLLGALSSGGRRAEEQLASSEERYRVLFENNPHPMWVYDRSNLHFLDVNEAAVLQYGYSRAEFLRMTLADIRPPEESPHARVESGNTPPTMQRSGVWRHRKKDGSLIEVDITSSQMKLLGPDARLVLARDVTEQRRAERAKDRAESALREAMQRLVSHVDNSPLAVIEWDESFRVRRWSGEAERIFGWRAQDVLGKHPSEWKFVHEADGPAVEQVMRAISGGDEARNVSINRNYSSTGAVVHCEWHNSVLKNEAGRAVGVLSLVADISKRVAAEVALKANEERFELVVRGANDGVWDWDLETDSHYWSPRFRELIGDTDHTEPSSYMSWEHSLHDQDRARVLAALRAHLEDHEPFDVEYRARTVRHEWRWFRSRGQAVWDASGKPTRMVGSIADITDRRMAQEQLKETAEKYQSLVETTDTGYAATDEQGRIIDANAEYIRLTGRTEFTEILGRTPLEWTAPGHREKNLESFRQLALRGMIRGLEVDYCDPRGGLTPVEINATLVTTAQGRRVLALVRDITERRKAQAQVAEWKARYEAAATASRQLVYELVHDTGEILWGGPCEPLFGSSSASLSTLPDWVARVHPEDRPAYEQAKRKLNEARDTFHLEYRVRREDGSYVHVEDTARFYTDASGHATRMVGFVADVTERARAREELARRAAELSRSNAELERFAYVASHDLQEPLRMVTSFTQLLADRYKGQLDPDADEFITYAVEGATRMRRLIDDLLTYSRVGSTPRRLTKFHARVALDKALSNLHAAVSESGAQIEVGDLPTITADELQITLVFQNLIGNAIKFRRQGESPRVRIQSVQENGSCRISVRDDGIGIDPKHRERVFTMFQRLNPRSHYPGNGIGLTICKRIIEDMGGCIQVDDAPDRGSVFSFTIPATVRIKASEQEVSQ